MISFSVLSGGSKGNSTFVRAAGQGILFDAGLSFRELLKRMNSVGLNDNDYNQEIPQIQGLFISHEHSDHTRGIGVIHRKTGCPVYLTAGTLRNLPSNIGKVEDFRVISRGETIEIGTVKVTSFAVNHDAAEPVGYTLDCGGMKFGLATDLGCPTNIVRAKLSGCHAIVIESNHDRRMLMTGPYPPELKTRVNGNRGHLSNESCGRLLEEIVSRETLHVVLTHLSEENNTRILALTSAREALARACRKLGMHGDQMRVVVASQDQATPLMAVTADSVCGEPADSETGKGDVQIPVTLSLPF
ncbi:MAG: MBL fold metallo-hydrolase [Candidatus Wallbacteria bacterium HGW-Wallbacteria-1]|jgi:phosphoribosyl 1,2-cyclic phosphodiesterase|uniref:MBL fold metallo-hydrolase n=1 Tax=Candidatus Wallbacteria bacterium HGW-Wallbacteria-1 TaxID=2013854 RepID=A0A2N1PVA2_9BACT|nr:MAG: MBL fold metallo-hydrolase [Candidatus Wallbacteria bacterium HGW-Wallbacteria-1]